MSYKSRITCLKCSSVLIFMLFMQFSHAQSSKKNDREYGVSAFPGMDALLTKHQKALGTDVTALVWKDTLVFKKEMGEFNVKSDAPLALSSQWLTTALILVLADEGKISLDDKVSDYIPIFSTYGKNYITIRHCLSHHTGIMTGQKLMDGKIESLEAEAASFAKKEIQTNPGTEFRYSNAGYIIAGRIAEIVTKRKYDQLIKQKLLNPLTMSKTSFSTMDGSGINPASGAKSTATDIMKFLQMLLNDGSFNGKQILSRESVQEMRKLYAGAGSMAATPKGASGFSHALGSWVMESNGEEATVLTSPGMYGVWPVVDWCRGYAMLILPKTMQAEQTSTLFIQIKKAADESFPVQKECK